MSQDALAALLSDNLRAREARSVALSKRVAEALSIADELESNCRAALGIELNSCIANQNHLEAAVQKLRAHIAALARAAPVYAKDYAALARAAEELGSPQPFLEGINASLQRSYAHFDYIAGVLG